LAGWWLAGGGNLWKLPLLLLGMSALYTGGMFLNDAFDADFDQQRRASRPIPSGKIPLATVWRFGWGWLGLGVLCLLFLGKAAALLAFVLVACILIYNATHKFVTVSPWLMGVCRFWVYVIAGTAGVQGLGGWPVWCGAALALYVVGLSYVARRESFRGPVPYWPLLLLLAPVGLALLMDQGAAQKPALLVSLILGLWIARCVHTVFLAGEINVGRIVSGLLAGIVFVDWLAIAPHCPTWLGGILLLLFGATLLAQRFVPAT
jgi:4-hydroxybenzoate polyprenyltransferase